MFIGQNFHVAISSTNVTKAGLLYQLTFTYVQSINDNVSGLSAMVWSPNQGLWNLLVWEGEGLNKNIYRGYYTVAQRYEYYF